MNVTVKEFYEVFKDINPNKGKGFRSTLLRFKNVIKNENFDSSAYDRYYKELKKELNKKDNSNIKNTLDAFGVYKYYAKELWKEIERILPEDGKDLTNKNKKDFNKLWMEANANHDNIYCYIKTMKRFNLEDNFILIHDKKLAPSDDGFKISIFREKYDTNKLPHTYLKINDILDKFTSFLNILPLNSVDIKLLRVNISDDFFSAVFFVKNLRSGDLLMEIIEKFIEKKETVYQIFNNIRNKSDFADFQHSIETEINRRIDTIILERNITLDTPEKKDSARTFLKALDNLIEERFFFEIISDYSGANVAGFMKRFNEKMRSLSKLMC